MRLLKRISTVAVMLSLPALAVAQGMGGMSGMGGGMKDRGHHPMMKMMDNPSCQAIEKACEEAGFTKGGAHEGHGLFAHCMRGILGDPPSADKMPKIKEPLKTDKPLPKIDSKVADECKAKLKEMHEEHQAMREKMHERKKN